jgi:hypothetical protein
LDIWDQLVPRSLLPLKDDQRDMIKPKKGHC